MNEAMKAEIKKLRRFGGYNEYSRLTDLFRAARYNLKNRGVLDWEAGGGKHGGCDVHKTLQFLDGPFAVHVYLCYDNEPWDRDHDEGEVHEDKRRGDIPAKVRGDRVLEWYTPPSGCSVPEMTKYYKGRGASRSVAYELALQATERNLSYYRKLRDNEVPVFIVDVELFFNGVKLGSGAVYGVETSDDYEDDPYLVDCVQDQIYGAWCDAVAKAKQLQIPVADKLEAWKIKLPHERAVEKRKDYIERCKALLKQAHENVTKHGVFLGQRRFTLQRYSDKPMEPALLESVSVVADVFVKISSDDVEVLAVKEGSEVAWLNSLSRPGEDTGEALCQLVEAVVRMWNGAYDPVQVEIRSGTGLRHVTMERP